MLEAGGVDPASGIEGALVGALGTAGAEPLAGGSINGLGGKGVEASAGASFTAGALVLWLLSFIPNMPPPKSAYGGQLSINSFQFLMIYQLTFYI